MAASSSSDEYNSGDSSEDYSRVEEGKSHPKGQKRKFGSAEKRKEQQHDDDENSYDSSDSDDQHDGYDYDDDDDNSVGASASNDSASDDNEEDVDNTHDSLPIADRLKLMEQQGVNLKPRRERREKALWRTKESLQQAKASSASSSSTTPYTRVKSSSTDQHLPKAKRSKHAPTEASSKRSDFYNQKPTFLNGLGVDLGAHKYKPRDPRQSDLVAGTFDAQQFDRNYEFLIDYRKQEIATLKQRIKARQVTGRKGQQLRKKLQVSAGSLEDDRATMKRLQQELADHERQQVARAVQQRVKKQLAEERGSQYHPKRAELKKLQLEAKFDELKKRGGTRAVTQALAKKRKKNKSRDAARMGRQVTDQQSQQY